MQTFFGSQKEIQRFLSQLKQQRCPHCGATQTMVRHGFIRGFTANQQSGIRGWRIRCKKSPLRKGCGKTPSICLADTLARRFYTARQLWLFLQALCSCPSIKAAWETQPFGFTLDTAYRLFKRINLCQSVLRTRLCSRGPPPEMKKAVVPLFQVFAHLKKTLGDFNPTQQYQELFQKGFLATT